MKTFTVKSTITDDETGEVVGTVESEAILPNLQYTAGVAIQKAAQEWVNEQSEVQ